MLEKETQNQAEETNPDESDTPITPEEPENPSPVEPGNPEEPDEPSEPDTPTPPPEKPEPKYLYQTIDNFYDRVRSSLGIGNAITDEEIDLFENAPMAELKMVKRVPEYYFLNDEKYMLFESCIVYATCYALCPVVASRRITKQKDPSLEIQFATSTEEKPCERFAALIEDLLLEINETEVDFFVGFQTTPPSNPECCRWIPKVHSIIIKENESEPAEGTNDHSLLINRDLEDQHPIEAISGLDDITESEIQRIWNSIN